MKILLIGPLPLPIDGCSNANKVLLKNFQNRNVQCDYINTNTPVISGKQGTSFSFKKALSFIRNYFSIFKIFKADAVYITPGQTFYGVLKYGPYILMCLLAGKAYTIHIHGNFLGTHYRSLSGIKKRIFHFLISRASSGIVITKSLSKNFEGLLAPQKVFVVEYFVEDELYKSNFTKRSDKLRILYLSNLMREKGVLEFLDSLISLQASNIDFTATLAGSVEKGLEAEIEKRLELLKNRVTYAGVVQGPSKVNQLAEANVFVLPTYYTMEGLPFSLLEAMATGNIIITTAHAGIPDVITEANGFLVAKKSSAEIETCLKQIHLDIAGMVPKFCAYNKQYSLTHFTEQNYTDKILNILHATAKS